MGGGSGAGAAGAGAGAGGDGGGGGFGGGGRLGRGGCRRGGWRGRGRFAEEGWSLAGGPYGRGAFGGGWSWLRWCSCQSFTACWASAHIAFRRSGGILAEARPLNLTVDGVPDGGVDVAEDVFWFFTLGKPFRSLVDEVADLALAVGQLVKGRKVLPPLLRDLLVLLRVQDIAGLRFPTLLSSPAPPRRRWTPPWRADS